MRIFLDTADVDLIGKYFDTGLIDGVTTNPTLIRKSGRDPEEVYKELVILGINDISMEIVTDDYFEFLQEGRRLYEKFGESTTIKVPCTPDGLRGCKLLSDEGIRVNVTLVFSSAQAILASKAGASYVSPFVGRVKDNSFDGLSLIREISDIYQTQSSKIRTEVGRTIYTDVRAQILSASIRDVLDVTRSFQYGADIVTMPPSVFEKMYDHVLTEKGLDLFQKDWETVNALNF
jgi:transaldolase|tara:strand:+ start:93 stop:791 length:699 start_codon:yes stop_codon:yes gene_type:complete